MGCSAGRRRPPPPTRVRQLGIPHEADGAVAGPPKFRFPLPLPSGAKAAGTDCGSRARLDVKQERDAPSPTSVPRIVSSGLRTNSNGPMKAARSQSATRAAMLLGCRRFRRRKGQPIKKEWRRARGGWEQGAGFAAGDRNRRELPGARGRRAAKTPARMTDARGRQLINYPRQPRRVSAVVPDFQRQPARKRDHTSD